MYARTLVAMGVLLCLVRVVPADEVQYVVRDGVTYRESRRIERTPVVENGWEQRSRTVYTEQQVTQMWDTHRVVYIPVTEYHCEPYWQNWWNPLSPPCVSYRIRPTVHWTTRVEKTQIPVTRRQLVPENEVVRVPVRKLRMAEREVVDRVPANPSYAAPLRGQVPGSGARADGQVGGIARLDGDPPRRGIQLPAPERVHRR